MHGVGDVRFFDRTAPLYDLVMPAANPDVLTDAFDIATGSIHRILDVAGGSGRASMAIADRPNAGDPIVVDASTGMVKQARDRGLTVVRGDAMNLPIGSATIDAAMIVDALHHVPDRKATLNELFRVLRPGGVAVIREFDPDHPLGRLLVAGESAIGMGSTFVSPEELLASLEIAGFDPTVLDDGFVYTAVGRVPDLDATLDAAPVGSGDCGDESRR
ncbi:class I SAM-dependent methyltransferase [Halopenitus sp. H-Gu1]|uniref:class I SAM-dependent methyltransferase n=1 Tax=Halopenitus sp. H-Gu1 TaxID=3242697 RepID=UPI00359E1F66